MASNQSIPYSGDGPGSSTPTPPTAPTPVMPKPPADGSFPPLQYFIDSWNYAWSQYQKTPGGNQSSTPNPNPDPNLNISTPTASDPLGLNGLLKGIEDLFKKQTDGMQQAASNALSNAEKQAVRIAIFAGLAVLLFIGIWALIMPTAEQSEKIVDGAGRLAAMGGE